MISNRLHRFETCNTYPVEINAWGKVLNKLAYQAMIEEALLTPKPGLVDRRNSGSHQDMNLHTFLRSARVVSNRLTEFVCLGYDFGNTDPRQLLLALRSPGIACELSMYQITQGINTHKGAIFAFGLLCTAAGRLLAHSEAIAAHTLCQQVKQICRGMVMRELASVKVAKTAGERFYQLYGLTGARGEAESGYATVLNHSLPAYTHALSHGLTNEQALHQALLTLMAHNDDTNLVSRGGIDGLQFVQHEAKALLTDGGMTNPRAIERLLVLDDSFIANNLSPGGSADLLAVTWFLAHLPGFLEQ